MSEVTQVTPQATPAAAPRRSFAGPLVLVLVGVVFLLANFGALSVRAIGLWFANWWPLLLIIWGLHKVWEYYQAKQGGYTVPGIGFGGVFGIVMLILIGSSITGITRVWPDLPPGIVIDGDDEEIFGGIFGRKHYFTETMEQAFPAGGSLRVASDRGDIQVVAGADDQLRVLINKVVVAESQTRAESDAAGMKPNISVAGNVVTISANTRAGAMNMEIQIPRKAAVDLMTGRGDIRVTGREGAVKVHTARGDVTVEDVNGSATIHLSRGDLRATHVTGDVTAEGRGDETVMEDIGGRAVLQGEYDGPVRFAKVAKGLQFKSLRTNVETAALEGEVMFEGDDLHAMHAAGPVKVLTRSYNVRLEDVSGDVRVENKNGEVHLRPGKLPLGNIEITNDRGSIRLELPSRADFLLDATAERGEIESDFDELRIERQSRNAKASGKVGSGGSHIRLSADRSHIEIRKAD